MICHQWEYEREYDRQKLLQADHRIAELQERIAELEAKYREAFDVAISRNTEIGVLKIDFTTERQRREECEAALLIVANEEVTFVEFAAAHVAAMTYFSRYPCQERGG